MIYGEYWVHIPFCYGLPWTAAKSRTYRTRMYCTRSCTVRIDASGTEYRKCKIMPSHPGQGLVRVSFVLNSSLEVQYSTLST